MGENGGGKKFVVQIPSTQDVEQNSSSRAQSFNFFRPSITTGGAASAAGAGLSAVTPQPQRGQGLANGQGSSFTEAFSFLRNTEFYSPPPAPAPAPTPPPPLSAASASTSAFAQSSGALPSTATFSKQEVNLAALSGTARNAILVSRRQQGNPILKHIRNVRWMFTDIVPDYILGQTSCALYLSLRYHLLHPDYLYFRIRELMKGFRLRVVLCHVDVDDVIKPLHEVTKTCLLHDCSLLCAWSREECARYLETIKSYENKPADYIQERTDSDYLSRLTNALTTVRHVNKTNVVTLGSTFGTLSGVFNASMDELARCPGIGERKVKRLYDAFHEPFRRVPVVKVPDATSQISEAQTQTAEAGEKTGEANETDGHESLPTSKLISREGDVSVREALEAVRGKLKAKTSPSKKASPSPNSKEKTSPTKKEKASPNKRRRATDMPTAAEEPMGLDTSTREGPEEIVCDAIRTVTATTIQIVDQSHSKNEFLKANSTEQAPEILEDDYIISLDDD